MFARIAFAITFFASTLSFGLVYDDDLDLHLNHPPDRPNADAASTAQSPKLSGGVDHRPGNGSGRVYD